MEKDNKTDSASNTNKTNKKYKDTVFRMIFNNKKEALGLYNNLFDTKYAYSEGFIEEGRNFWAGIEYTF